MKEGEEKEWTVKRVKSSSSSSFIVRGFLKEVIGSIEKRERDIYC